MSISLLSSKIHKDSQVQTGNTTVTKKASFGDILLRQMKPLTESFKMKPSVRVAPDPSPTQAKIQAVHPNLPFRK